MSEATVTALPSKPTSLLECADCGRTFGRPQALGRHRTATHGAKAKVSHPAAAKPLKVALPKPPTIQPANERQLLAIVAQAYHDLNGADVATCIDSAAEILDAITNASWRIVEA